MIEKGLCGRDDLDGLADESAWKADGEPLLNGVLDGLGKIEWQSLRPEVVSQSPAQ